MSSVISKLNLCQVFIPLFCQSLDKGNRYPGRKKASCSNGGSIGYISNGFIYTDIKLVQDRFLLMLVLLVDFIAY